MVTRSEKPMTYCPKCQRESIVVRAYRVRLANGFPQRRHVAYCTTIGCGNRGHAARGNKETQ